MHDGKYVMTKNMTMIVVNIFEAKAKLSEVLNRVEGQGERYVIQRRGKPVAAVVPLHDLPLAEQLTADDWLGALLDMGAEGKRLGESLDEIVKARAGRSPRQVGLGDE